MESKAGELINMPKIRPVSDLRTYGPVLKDCREGEPVFLTRNGRGKYVILDIHDYEQLLGGSMVSVDSGSGIGETRVICMFEEE